MIKDTAGVTIPHLKANPSTKIVGDATQQAMIESSKITFSIAASIISLGFVFTWMLPKSSTKSQR